MAWPKLDLNFPPATQPGSVAESMLIGLSLALCGVAVLLLATGVLALLLVPPLFLPLLRETEVSLGWMTEALINAPLGWLLGVSVAAAGVLVLKEWLIRRPWVRVLVNLGVLLALWLWLPTLMSSLLLGVREAMERLVM